MPKVQDILDTKGRQVHSIGPTATVLDAARAMNRAQIGSLVVLDGDRLVGIITERDILRRLVEQHLDALETTVDRVMTTEVVCCKPYTPLAEARGVLKNRRIRHLPVLDDDDRLCGLISIGDLNAFDSQNQERTIHVLEAYIHGRV